MAIENLHNYSFLDNVGGGCRVIPLMILITFSGGSNKEKRGNVK